MLSGIPMTSLRAFGGIFNSCTNFSTHRHCFLHIYDKFEGDLQVCLAIYNAYLHTRMSAMGKAQKKRDKKMAQES